MLLGGWPLKGMSCGSLFPGNHSSAEAMLPAWGCFTPMWLSKLSSISVRYMHAVGGTETSQWKWFSPYLDLSSLLQFPLLDNALQSQLGLSSKFN